MTKFILLVDKYTELENLPSRASFSNCVTLILLAFKNSFIIQLEYYIIPDRIEE